MNIRLPISLVIPEIPFGVGRTAEFGMELGGHDGRIVYAKGLKRSSLRVGQVGDACRQLIGPVFVALLGIERGCQCAQERVFAAGIGQSDLECSHFRIG